MLKPILIASDGVSDTSELFMHGYQLVKMFGEERLSRSQTIKAASDIGVSSNTLSELKIGKIAQTFFYEALEGGKADDDEITLMTTREFSKNTLGIDFSLLAPLESECDSARYYAKPLVIRGKKYRLCSQWFEVPTNNDRPFLLAWLEEHGVEL